MNKYFLFIAAGTCLLPFTAHAQEKATDTITLGYALQQAESNHPEIEQSQARIERAEADRLDADALTGINASIDARLRYVQPNDVIPDQSRNDNSVSLFVSKNLYDFGRSEAADRVADSALKSANLDLASVRNQRRLDIMRRYFDVMLADLAYLRDNEDMAVAYIAYDKTRDRAELGQRSDVELFDLKNRYEQVRLKRYRSDTLQRSKRGLLAAAMNQPEQLPETLEDPKLPSLKRKLPEFENIKQDVLGNNPALLAARAEVDANLARLELIKADDNPTLSGEFEASENARDIGSRDEYRIGLRLKIPLSSGGKTKARIARQQAAVRDARAKLAILKVRLDQATLDTWLELNNLRAQHDQAIAQLDYSELYLDQRRALYELEAKANLGDAMVQISEAQRYLKETEFAIAYNWAKLDALSGRVVYATAKVTKEDNTK